MSWDLELQALERAIHDLNAEYDTFLYGSAGKPPLDSRRRVEQMLRRLGAREPDSAADRYRLTTLQGRYNAFCERWDRLLTEKESGKRPGLYGGFARDSRHIATLPSRGEQSNAGRGSSVQKEGGVDRDGELFERYLAARRSRGDDVRGHDLARFKENLQREREKIKRRFGNVEVEFEVAEREGRVKLVARRRVAADGSSVGGEKKP